MAEDPYFQGVVVTSLESKGRTNDPLVDLSNLKLDGGLFSDEKDDEEGLFNTHDVRAPSKNDEFFKGEAWKPPPRVIPKNAKKEAIDEDDEPEVIQDIQLKTVATPTSTTQTVTVATPTPTSKPSTPSPAPSSTAVPLPVAKTTVGKDISHVGVGKAKTIDLDDELFGTDSFGSTGTGGDGELTLEQRIAALTSRTQSKGLFDD